MTDDFLSAIGVADPTEKARGKATDPLDTALRTVYAESGPNPDERRWVASVIANRAKASGKSLSDVVKEPGQFEAWSRPEARKRMEGLDPASEDYQKLLTDLGPILRGDNDPSGGATKFYAPKAQAELSGKDGRPSKPAWDDGSGVDVGQTRFFGGKEKTPDDFLSAIGVDKSAAEATQPDEPGTLRFTDMKTHASKEDSAAYLQLVKGGVIKKDAALGSENNPYGIQPGMTEKDVPAGAYYIAHGKLNRAAGGAKESSAFEGGLMGAGDVVASISHLAPGTDGSDIKNALLAGQQVYNAKYGGDLKSGAGRFMGQLLTSAPILAAGGEVAAPALRAAGPVGEFLAGKAGQALPSGAARFLTRGASLAAQGAQQGAGAAALTSSADDAPVAQQVAQGAVGGALLGPLAPAVEGAGGAVVRGVKALIEPFTPQGPAKMANRIVGAFHAGSVGKADASELIPGSVPTLGPASADPGVATLERTVRLGEHGPAFTARDEANKTARATFLDTVRGDRQRIADLEDARDTATAGARDAALKAQTKPADIKPVLDTIDAMLKGPEGKQKEVAKALIAVRENLHDAGGNPETSAEMLYGVRKDLNDLLSPKASSERKGAQLATSQLIKVRGEIDNAIQDVASGFKEYLKSYSDLSKPINEAQWLQQQKMLDVNGHPTLAKVQGTLDRIQAAKAKPGANDAKSISDDTIAQLKALRDDLKRAGNLTLQKPGGSDTAQHFTTGGRLAQAGVPVAGLAALAHHPVFAAAIGGGKLLYGMKDKQIMGEVANRLLNPAPVVRPVVRQAKSGPLKRLAAPVVPAVGGMLANRLVGAQ